MPAAVAAAAAGGRTTEGRESGRGRPAYKPATPPTASQEQNDHGEGGRDDRGPAPGGGGGAEDGRAGRPDAPPQQYLAKEVGVARD